MVNARNVSIIQNRCGRNDLADKLANGNIGEVAAIITNVTTVASTLLLLIIHMNAFLAARLFIYR
jgi:hypothetical protein